MTARPNQPHPLVLASDQVADAAAYSNLDFRREPRWRWRELDNLVERLLPGDLWILGALVGNGKTAFLLSQADALASQGCPVLYVPLELDPMQVRRQWAAWKCGYPWETVARNGWDDLPFGAFQRHKDELLAQHNNGVHFPPDRRITVDALDHWVKWGVEHANVRCVIVDHFHRMSLGGGEGFRISATEAARSLKDMAREYHVALLVAAQLNRMHANAVLDRCIPPRLERLKETSGLAEEADVVLMLSRSLRRDADLNDLKRFQVGHASERELEEPEVMLVTCRKHRRRDAARDHTIRLKVVNGRVEDE